MSFTPDLERLRHHFAGRWITEEDSSGRYTPRKLIDVVQFGENDVRGILEREDGSLCTTSFSSSDIWHSTLEAAKAEARDINIENGFEDAPAEEAA